QLRPDLPGRVRGAVTGNLVGTTVDADDAIRVGLFERQDRVSRLRLPGIVAARNVLRNFVQVLRRLQFVQRPRRFFLVLCVLVDGLIQGFQVLAQVLLPRPRDAVAVEGQSYAQQDQNDADHHHHLDQRESAVPSYRPSLHLRTLFANLVLPTRIGSALGGDLLGTAVNTSDAGLGRIPRILRVFRLRLPGIAAGDVIRDELDV